MSSTTAVTSTLSQLLDAATAIPTDGSAGFANDPILAQRPHFALSMPVQVLLIGVVLTLMGVLLGHLLFTAQYHFPLAPTNFALQVAGVLTLLTTQVAMIHVVFSSAMHRSDVWPYMFDYIAIDLPPFTSTNMDTTHRPHMWTSEVIAAWSLMNAATSAIVQITHIQFLTLLYPSKLERNLILSILGPLALTSAAMQMMALSSNPKLVEHADIVNNVCDATLSLLFTAALLLWGFVVNRREAWRMDGGTAAFGAAACFLALISTALTFLYLPKRDQYGWLPSLILAVILWQSFLGWWWWVGAAGAGSPAHELVAKQERRRQRKAARNARKLARNDAAKEWWRGFTSTFSPAGSTASRTGSRLRNQVEKANTSDEEPNISRSPSSDVGARRRMRPEDASSTAGASSFPSTSVVSSSTISAGRPAYTRWFNSLRQAHRHAARQQAAVHHERVAQAYGPAAAEGDAPIGWGLGSYGARELAARREELEAQGEYVALEERGRGKERRRPVAPPAQPTGVWWWGPLRRWRLQDSTSYQ